MNTTLTIEYYVQQIESFEEFEQKFSEDFLNDDYKVGVYLERLMWKYNKNAATVSEQAGLHRSYVGNIIRGKKNGPTRDAVIAICLAIGTTVEEVQYLLKYAGHSPLYVRRKRDVIIWFGFMKRKTIMEVDMDLEKRGYKTFFKYD